MGFELERFESRVDEELICTICSGVLEDPVQVQSCEHTFCNGCIKQWCLQQAICPIDRAAITLTQLRAVPRITRNMLARLSMKCKNYEHGCRVPLRLEEMSNHLLQCQYDPNRPVYCLRGCGLTVPKDELKTHNCARDLQKMLTEQKLSLNGLSEEVQSQGKMLQELQRDVQQIKEFTRALRIVHPNLRVLLERSERDELLLWSRSLTRTRVSRWSNLLPTPDHQYKLLIRTALLESNCPERIMEALAANCHERRWPQGLANQAAREVNEELLDDFICRRLPRQSAIVLLSVDNGHMGEDMIIEPGISIYFLNGFD